MFYIAKVAAVSVGLNLALPMILNPVATEKERTACINDTDLNIKEKFMVMILHHKMMPVMSSLIVALVLALSIMIAVKI